MVSDVAVLSHAGRVRSVNEDAAGCLPLGVTAAAQRRMAMVICDGVGGRQAGATASSRALVRLGELLNDPWWILEPHDAHWQQHVEQRLVSMINALNEEIAREAQSTDALRGMATTLACLLMLGNWYCAVHVGDSRIYLLRGDRLQQLTVDHNWAEEQQRIGRLTAEEIAASPYREQLMQVVGLGRSLEPSISFGRLAPGDRLLVCSDGLTKHVSAQQIGMTLRNEPSASQMASRLLEYALAGGGTDNISVVVSMVRSVDGSQMFEPESATLRLDRGALATALSQAGTPHSARRRVSRLLIPTVVAAVALVAVAVGLFHWRPQVPDVFSVRKSRAEVPKQPRSTTTSRNQPNRPSPDKSGVAAPSTTNTIRP